MIGDANAKLPAFFALIVDHPSDSSRSVSLFYVARNSGGGRSSSDSSLTDFFAFFSNSEGGSSHAPHAPCAHPLAPSPSP